MFITNDNKEIKLLIEREDYAAIIVNSDAHLLKRIRTFGYKGPLIFESQGLGTKREATKFLKFTAKENINRYSDALLYPKTAHLQQLMNEIFQNKKQYSIHNCIDTDVFSFKNKVKLPHEIIIGWVGRIEQNKNWKACLLITKRLFMHYPHLQLWLFIDDTLTTQNEKRKFEYTLQQLRLENVVHIHSNIPHHEMPNYYSKIAKSGGFLLSTSLTEGFGYAVLEALCCQCPVLTSDSDGIKSFVFHNVTGKIYSQGNINEAFHEAIELISNTTLRKKLINQGTSYVKKYFSLQNYAKEFQAMLKEVVLSTNIE